MLPMSGGGATIHFNIKGRPPAGPEQYTMAGYRAVSGSYFQTLGIPLKQGRLLERARSTGRRRASSSSTRRWRGRTSAGERRSASASSSVPSPIRIRSSPTWKSSASWATCASSRTPRRSPRCTCRTRSIRTLSCAACIPTSRWSSGAHGNPALAGLVGARDRSRRSMPTSRSPTCGRWTTCWRRRSRSRGSARCCSGSSR